MSQRALVLQHMLAIPLGSADAKALRPAGLCARQKAGCYEHSTWRGRLGAACTCQVSLAHWNQDDEYGGFGGAHAMVRGGYSGLLEPLAARLDVRLGAPVARITDTSAGVRVTTASGARLQPSLPVLRPRQAHEHRVW